jgi:ATP-dependent DNA helicase RecG
MLFKDRLEIWNPGTLPYGLTPAKLKEPHNSIPGNPLLAEPMYLSGYIERMGTGTREIVKLCKEEGLKEPEFIQEEMFRTVIWRKIRSEQVTTEVTTEVTMEVTTEVRKLLLIFVDEMTRKELQKKLELRNDEHFRKAYIVPALEDGLIEYTIPDKPNSRLQKYRLTEKGKKVLKNINSEND